MAKFSPACQSNPYCTLKSSSVRPPHLLPPFWGPSLELRTWHWGRCQACALEQWAAAPLPFFPWQVYVVGISLGGPICCSPLLFFVLLFNCMCLCVRRCMCVQGWGLGSRTPWSWGCKWLWALDIHTGTWVPVLWKSSMCHFSSLIIVLKTTKNSLHIHF